MLNILIRMYIEYGTKGDILTTMNTAIDSMKMIWIIGKNKDKNY